MDIAIITPVFAHASRHLENRMKTSEKISTVIFWLVMGPFGLFLGPALVYNGIREQDWLFAAIGALAVIVTVAGIISAVRKMRRPTPPGTDKLPAGDVTR